MKVTCVNCKFGSKVSEIKFVRNYDSLITNCHIVVKKISHHRDYTKHEVKHIEETLANVKMKRYDKIL